MKSGEVLQIGGGNIGRALVGEVMSSAGLHVTFADVNDGLIQHFNTEHNYPVRVVSADGVAEHFVSDVDAISSLDETAMIEHIIAADVITTAVGAGILPRLAPTLALGLMERHKQRPADDMHVVVIACENMARNTETLRDHILAALPDDEWRATIHDMVSFPNAAVDRIVPDMHSTSDHPLAVTTEDYFQLAIDATALRSALPDIAGIVQTSDLEAVLAQKLFTLNAGHAAVAYWGHLKGYETISDAVSDTTIRRLVDGLFDEVGQVITLYYPSISIEQQSAFAAKTLRRFMNPYLKDTPARVGREPVRKLGQADRLLRPALLRLDAGEIPAHIGMAIVAAFRFDSDKDAQAQQIQHTIRSQGIGAAVVTATGLGHNHPIVQQTEAAYGLAELIGS